MDAALDEEIELLEKLARLQQLHGWADDHPAYKKALAQIKKEGTVARSQVGVGQGGATGSWQPKMPPPDRWAIVGTGTYPKLEQARVLLKKVDTPTTKWVVYRWTPNSKAEGGHPSVRYISKAQANGHRHARLVDLQDGTWRVDVPIWDSKDEESEEEEEQQPVPPAQAASSVSKEKKAAAKPAAKTAEPKKKKAPPPPPAVAEEGEPSSKRSRRAPARK